MVALSAWHPRLPQCHYVVGNFILPFLWLAVKDLDRDAQGLLCGGNCLKCRACRFLRTHQVGLPKLLNRRIRCCRSTMTLCHYDTMPACPIRGEGRVRTSGHGRRSTDGVDSRARLNLYYITVSLYRRVVRKRRCGGAEPKAVAGISKRDAPVSSRSNWLRTLP